MMERSARGCWTRTVRSSVSTAPDGWAREKIRGTSRRSEVVLAGVVSVMRSPPDTETLAPGEMLPGPFGSGRTAGSDGALGLELEGPLRLLPDRRLPLAHQRVEGRGQEDRRVRADHDADEQRERDVAQRAGSEQERTDEEDRGDRQDRDDRRVDRAHEGLVHR